MRLVKLSILIFYILLVFVKISRADNILNLGYGNIMLPSNSDLYAYVAPNGENTGTPYIYWNTTIQDNFGLGLSFNGYILKKYFFGYTYEWNIKHFSIYASYQIPVNINTSKLFLNLRLGGTIAPISYDAIHQTGTVIQYKSDNETKFGPYFGADIQIPVNNTAFVLSGMIEKSIISSSLLTKDVNVGALVYGIGFGYNFK